MDLIRREIKFQIPMRMVEPICNFIGAYCEMDKYSRLAHDGYYTINSLYLDNDSMFLLETKRRNEPRRFSVRIRSYGEEPQFPAFFEIKKRNDQFIEKKRSAITSWKTLDFIDRGASSEDNSDLDHPFMQRACYEVLRLGLRPKMMTRYRRLAFFGLFEPYSRVTFDREMRCYPENEFQVFPDNNKFISYDHEDQFVSCSEQVVLELKTELKIPGWMSQLIEKFELRQSQFSKFDSSWSFLTDLETYPTHFPDRHLTSASPLRFGFREGLKF